MLLEDKNAVIYGAGGAIGGAVAKDFAREGARVFLAGRTRDPLEAVAADISSAGGSAEVAVLDALDEEAVDEHARAMVSEAGSINVSFNLITRGDVQGIPLIEMKTDDLSHAVVNGLRSNFITARAAARHMVDQGSGVILVLDSGSANGSPDGQHRSRRSCYRHPRSQSGGRDRSPRRASGGHLDGRAPRDVL